MGSVPDPKNTDRIQWNLSYEVQFLRRDDYFCTDGGTRQLGSCTLYAAWKQRDIDQSEAASPPWHSAELGCP